MTWHFLGALAPLDRNATANQDKRILSGYRHSIMERSHNDVKIKISHTVTKTINRMVMVTLIFILISRGDEALFAAQSENRASLKLRHDVRTLRVKRKGKTKFVPLIIILSHRSLRSETPSPGSFSTEYFTSSDLCLFSLMSFYIELLVTRTAPNISMLQVF